MSTCHALKTNGQPCQCRAKYGSYCGRHKEQLVCGTKPSGAVKKSKKSAPQVTAPQVTSKEPRMVIDVDTHVEAGQLTLLESLAIDRDHDGVIWLAKNDEFKFVGALCDLVKKKSEHFAWVNGIYEGVERAKQEAVKQEK